uniref:C2H2-type domain-containing protein n=1 Tax=viral metagenome TaxID=1070528 RepID=A0A6C0ECP7_9ZZZZ
MYSCELCKYKTNDKSNWSKHIKTDKHKQREKYDDEISGIKKQKIIHNKNNKTHVCKNYSSLTCPNCGTGFAHKSSLSRHVNHRCHVTKVIKIVKQPFNKSAAVKSSVTQEEAIDYETTIKLLQMQHKIELLELENRMYKKQNEYQMKLTSNAGDIANKSLSALTYVVENYKNAPPIMPIEKEEFKRLIYEQNYGHKLHKNKKLDNFEICRIISQYFKFDKFDKLLNDIIVKHYKKVNPPEQPLWACDPARLTYVISKAENSNPANDLFNFDETNLKTQWITDKGGLNVDEMVIDPIMNYIDNMMEEYTVDLHKLNQINKIDDDTLIDELHNTSKIREYVRNDISRKKLNKAICPHFFISKELLTEN